MPLDVHVWKLAKYLNRNQLPFEIKSRYVFQGTFYKRLIGVFYVSRTYENINLSEVIPKITYKGFVLIVKRMSLLREIVCLLVVTK